MQSIPSAAVDFVTPMSLFLLRLGPDVIIGAWCPQHDTRVFDVGRDKQSQDNMTNYR